MPYIEFHTTKSKALGRRTGSSSANPGIRIMKYTSEGWIEEANFLIEVLIAAQLLYLNNFSE